MAAALLLAPLLGGVGEAAEAKRGESLWIIAQQRADLPVWLVAEYNPDVDFGDIRPGTTLVLPRIEAINRQ